MQVGSVEFTHPGAVRYVYLRDPGVARAAGDHRAVSGDLHRSISASAHSVAARRTCTRPSSWPSLRPTATKHIRLARWTFPIWLYVSVTGVVVYVMLYHLWPPAGQ